jgi:hypothetical protein
VKKGGGKDAGWTDGGGTGVKLADTRRTTEPASAGGYETDDGAGGLETDQRKPVDAS